MAKIETYTAGKLASARTSVLPADTSGQEIGTAVAQFAGVAHDVLAERKDAINRLAVESARTDIQTGFLRAQHEIMSDPNLTSDTVEERLQQAGMDIKSSVLSSISDGSTRQAVEIGIQGDMDQASVMAVKAKYDLQDKETLNRIFSNSTKLIDTVSILGDADKIPWAFKKLDETENTLLPFMNRDSANTQKYIQNSKDSLVKQFVAQGISSGREDELDAALTLGKFNGASSGTQEQISKDIRTALETKKYRADLTTSFQVINDNLQTYKDVKNGAKSFADIEHQLSEATYTLSTANLSDNQKRDIQGKITFLNSMRTAQLNQSYIRSRDDLDTKTELEVGLGQLVETYDGSKQLKEGVYLEQIKAYQDKLTKAFVDDGKISGKTYNNLYSEAMGVLYTGFAQSTFEKSGMEKFVSGIFPNATPKAMEPFISRDSRLPLMRIYDAVKSPDGTLDSKTMVSAFEEFLDDKDKGMSGNTIMTPELAQQYALRAKLKQQGYPGSYKTGDPIMVKGRSFTIAGFKNGEVLVQTDENTARNVVTYAKPYKATRN